MTHDRAKFNWRRRLVRGRNRSSSAVPWIQLTLATAIILLWVFITLKATFNPNFRSPEGLTSVTLLAAGFLFGSAFFKSRDSNDHREEDDE